MDVDILWDELRAQQRLTRDTISFEKFDRIFFQELLLALEKYQNKIITAANIPDTTDTSYLLANHEDIDAQEGLSQLQTALLHHTAAISHLSKIITKIYESAKKNPGSFTLFNPDNHLKSLPKITLLREFIANRMERYGQYLSTLHTTDPDAFRAHTIIIKNAQRELTTHLVHVLMQLLPYTLSNKSIADRTSKLSSDIIADFQKETPASKKYSNIWLYLKQFFLDTTTKFIVTIIEAMDISSYVGKAVVEFVTKKTTGINLEKLAISAIELSDLSRKTGLEVHAKDYTTLITLSKKGLLNQISELLKNLQLYFNADITDGTVFDSNKILEQIKLIEQLAPFQESKRVPLKDEKPPHKKCLFTQTNIAEIIADLKKLIVSYQLQLSNNLTSESIKTKERITIKLQQLNTLLSYSLDNADSEIASAVEKLEEKISLAKLYPTTERLFSAIDDLNEIIAQNTHTSIFGTQKKHSICHVAEEKRRELLNLLKIRATILLTNQPTPAVGEWDTFLLSASQAPLHKNTSWRNSFHALTMTSSGPRFSALLVDQLASLENITVLERHLQQLITDNKKTIPNLDKTELTKDQIVGTTHLIELANQLSYKSKKQSAYILYLQISSISAVLNSIDLPPPVSGIMLRLRATMNDLASNVKKQAQFSYYGVILPSALVFDDLINQISSIDAEVFPGLQKNKDLIIDTLERIKLYFHDRTEQHKASYTSEQRSKIRIKKLSMLRKILINLITFYERCVELGPVTVVSELFKTTPVTPIPNPEPVPVPVPDPVPNPEPVIPLVQPATATIADKKPDAVVAAQCVTKICSSAYKQSRCKKAETVACTRRTCRAIA